MYLQPRVKIHMAQAVGEPRVGGGLVWGTVSVRLSLRPQRCTESGEAFLEDGSTMPQRRIFLLPGKGRKLSQPKSMFLSTKNLEKNPKWLIQTSQMQWEASSRSAPSGPLLLLAFWSALSPSSPPQHL